MNLRGGTLLGYELLFEVRINVTLLLMFLNKLRTRLKNNTSVTGDIL